MFNNIKNYLSKKSLVIDLEDCTEYPTQEDMLVAIHNQFKDKNEVRVLESSGQLRVLIDGTEYTTSVIRGRGAYLLELRTD